MVTKDGIYKTPHFGTALLKIMIPDYDFEYVIGVYEAEYCDLQKGRGKFFAYIWFWMQLLRSAPVLVKEKLIRGSEMLKNYLKIAVRSIIRQKLNSFLNIVGLSLGIACALMIVFHVQDEMSYDTGFPKSDRMYRITNEGLRDNGRHWAVVSPLHGLLIQNDIPEIELTTRIYTTYMQILSYTPQNGEPRRFEERRGYYADSTAIEMFDLEFISGNPENSLRELKSVIVTEQFAEKYFGTENPIGKTLSLDNQRSGELVVTGIVKKPEFNSHFNFDYLVSMSTLYAQLPPEWQNARGWAHFYTYILVSDNSSIEQVEAKMDDFTANFYAERGTREEILTSTKLHLQPITDIHLHSNLEQEMGPNSDIAYVYIFSAVAAFILLIATVNFVNISTAQAFKRMKEVGVRKVLGAHRKMLVKQFFTETFLLVILGGVAASVLMYMFLPVYNSIAGKQLTVSAIASGQNLLLLLLIIVVTGLLSGGYPALFMAGFTPAFAIKGHKDPRSSASRLRKGLVVFQFIVSVFMIFSTLVVFSQMNFFRTKDLGFDKDRMIAVQIYGDLKKNFLQNGTALKQELLNYSGISNVSLVSNLPGERFSVENLQPDGTPDGASLPSVRYLRVDEDFIETLGIELIEGRSFKEVTPSDSIGAFIVNETLVKAYDRDDLVGTMAGNFRGVRGEIIGVAKDFNFASLHSRIEPLVLDFRPAWSGDMIAKIQGGSIPETIEFLRNTFYEMAPNNLFSYTFVDDSLNRLYAGEQVVSDVFKVFSILAIIISCLGLFGLSAYSAEIRTKEIGVRKVLGASNSNIVMGLSKDFIRWIVIANLLALPAGWYFMSGWLENFAYRTGISVYMFVFTVVIAFAIAAVTISYQSVKAARSNPVKSLRYE